MTNAIKSIFRYRLHVALLAGLMTLVPFAIDSSNGSLPAVGWLSGLAMALVMAAIYLSNKASDMAEDAINLNALPIDAANRRRVTIAAALCALIPLLWLWCYPPVLAVYLFFGVGLGYFYNYGVTLAGHHYRFKRMLVIKNVSSAIIWAGCSSLPYWLMTDNANPAIFASHIVSTLALVTCIEAIWDIRDIEGDRAAGVRTIANTFGINTAKAFCIVIFVGFIVWSYSMAIPSVVLILAHAATIGFIVAAGPKRSYVYYQSIVVLWAAVLSLVLV